MLSQGASYGSRTINEIRGIMAGTNPTPIVEEIRRTIEFRRSVSDKKLYASISQMINKLHDRASELIASQIADTVADWKEGIIRPRSLFQRKGTMLDRAKEAPTKGLKDAYWAGVHAYRELLAESSQKEAERILDGVSGNLASAEASLADAEPSDCAVHLAGTYLSEAHRLLGMFRLDGHLMHVGLPRVAASRQMKADEMLTGFKERADRASEVYDQAMGLVRERFERRLKMDHAQAIRDSETAARACAARKREAEMKRARQAMEKRCPVAIGHFDQFLAAVENGNAGDARTAMHRMQRLDGGGLPPVVTRVYGELLQSQQPAQPMAIVG